MSSNIPIGERVDAKSLNDGPFEVVEYKGKKFAARSGHYYWLDKEMQFCWYKDTNDQLQLNFVDTYGSVQWRYVGEQNSGYILLTEIRN